MKRLLKVFVYFHCLGIAAYCVPYPPLRNALTRPIRPYFRWIGLWQRWQMFAPEPVFTDAEGRAFTFKFQAEIERRNGERETWYFPEVEKLGFPERYYRGPFRNWVWVASSPKTEILRPDAARYVARQNARDPANPPVRVRFARTPIEILPPEERGDGPALRHFSQPRYYFSYDVTAEDLK